MIICRPNRFQLMTPQMFPIRDVYGPVRSQYFGKIVTESKFRETGVLTPDEFIIAGDHLVHHCPTWSWAKAADSSKTKQYLATDKQFLITKNVPCYRRCRDMEYDSAQEKILSEEDLDGFDMTDGEGWVDTHHYSADLSQKVSEMRLHEENESIPIQSVTNDDCDVDDGPPMDMEEFMARNDNLEDEDPNRLAQSAAVKPSLITASDTSAQESSLAEGTTEKTLSTRTYDLHITYDKYYQVPRMWLIGYNEQRKLLTVNEMYEDFSQDHVKKTITIETHPHLNCPPTASIHPCRHAEVMKRLVEQLAENGRELAVHQYLLIFLKFVQAIIPTVEYDYTRSIQL